jgi:hypothetical protein
MRALVISERAVLTELLVASENCFRIAMSCCPSMQIQRQHSLACQLSRVNGAARPVVNLMIAATAIHHGLTVATLNALDFDVSGRDRRGLWLMRYRLLYLWLK